MKVLVVGDQHFRFNLPYYGALEDGRREEWGAVQRELYRLSEDCAAIVLMGDNFNARHNHSSVNREFVEFLTAFGDKDIYILSGNHERYGEETAIDFLSGVNPRWHVITKPTDSRSIGGRKSLQAVFLPFMTPGALGVKDVADAKAHVEKELLVLAKGMDQPILFHHHVAAGTVVGGADLSELNEIVLDTKKLEKTFSKIIGGHIHKTQRVSEKTLVTGSIFTQEVGEHEKFAWILETETGEAEAFPLPVRPIYGVEWEGEASLKGIPNSAIVKCTVTNREVGLEEVHSALSRFDSYIIVEKYRNERSKVDLKDVGSLDFSLDGLIDLYVAAKGVKKGDLIDALGLLDS